MTELQPPMARFSIFNVISLNASGQANADPAVFPKLKGTSKTTKCICRWSTIKSSLVKNRHFK